MNQSSESFFVGRAVSSLQTMLRVISRTENGIPAVIPDGVYGHETQAAVTAFQKRHGLPATGIADFDTWRAIAREYRRARVDVDPAAPLDVVMNTGQVIEKGSSNLHVGLIQAMLHALHEVYGNLPDCPVSGICCSGTVEAVKALQRCCGTEPSGIIDKQVWRMLAGLYTQAVGDGDRETHCGAGGNGKTK